MSPSLPNSRHCFVCGIDNPRGLALKFHNENGRVFTQVTLPKPDREAFELAFEPGDARIFGDAEG